MMITIKYFGLLAEVTGCRSEKMNFSCTTISDLKEILFQKHKVLKNKKFKIAQHNELNTDKTKVTSSEIALLPPFAGG
ncbi:MAG: MoaD/ThiS family protein [Flavobacteriaceae bacterium]|nr:MoaD/ThiS family protein [Flavobacteriaceae bacterium]